MTDSRPLHQRMSYMDSYRTFADRVGEVQVLEIERNHFRRALVEIFDMVANDDNYSGIALDILRKVEKALGYKAEDEIKARRMSDVF